MEEFNVDDFRDKVVAGEFTDVNELANYLVTKVSNNIPDVWKVLDDNIEIVYSACNLDKISNNINSSNNNHLKGGSSMNATKYDKLPEPLGNKPPESRIMSVEEVAKLRIDPAVCNTPQKIYDIAEARNVNLSNTFKDQINEALGRRTDFGANIVKQIIATEHQKALNKDMIHDVAPSHRHNIPGQAERQAEFEAKSGVLVAQRADVNGPKFQIREFTNKETGNNFYVRLDAKANYKDGVLQDKPKWEPAYQMERRDMPIMQPKLDDAGQPMKDATGKPIVELKVDKNGQEVTKAQYMPIPQTDKEGNVKMNENTGEPYYKKQTWPTKEAAIDAGNRYYDQVVRQQVTQQLIKVVEYNKGFEPPAPEPAKEQSRGVSLTD